MPLERKLIEELEDQLEELEDDELLLDELTDFQRLVLVLAGELELDHDSENL